MIREARRKLAHEPVRVRLYTLAVALLALAVAAGKLDHELSGAGAAVVAVLLGVPAVESARARVAPLDRPEVVDERGERRVE